MRGSRRGRPSLLGTMGRTAVIAGTAQMTANAVNDRAARRRGAALPPQPPAAPPPPPSPVAPPPPAPAPPETDLVASLSRLAHLRDSGALTEEEFQAAKARILA